MMSFEHKQAAEDLLASLDSGMVDDRPQGNARWEILAQAQIHATLASVPDE